VADHSPAPRPDRLPALDAVTGTKPRVEPLDPPMVPFVLGGMGLFAAAGVVFLVAGAPRDWLWVCLSGFVWGIVGLLWMLRHDADRRRRRALSHPEFRVDS
jgi:hypothetical protein